MLKEFYESLIAGGAWHNILMGLEVTLRISACSLLIGTLLAAPLCACRRAKGRGLSGAAKAVIAFLRGTPVLMLLMVFYYVVFNSVRIDASIIAIAAFSLNVAANVAEIMRSALDSVNVGQRDAAWALGMSRAQVFRYVTLPQAARFALPVYQSAAVNLVQWTSVVGYVSIVDLTRAINFISARTLQPFLMLFVGIILYLLLAYLIYFIFGRLGKIRLGMSHRYYRRNKV